MHLSIADGAVIAGALLMASAVRLAAVVVVAKLAARSVKKTVREISAPVEQSRTMAEHVRTVIGGSE